MPFGGRVIKQFSERFPGTSWKSSGLRSDNPRRAVNQFPIQVRRRGETASGKRHWGARLAFQAGIGSKRRDAEVPKTRPVADLRTERDVNERAGDGAEKRFGSPSATLQETGSLHSG